MERTLERISQEGRNSCRKGYFCGDVAGECTVVEDLTRDIVSGRDAVMKDVT